VSEPIAERIPEGMELTTLFQPILNLAGSGLYGFEALTRGPADTPFVDPGLLFGHAERTGQLAFLERTARQRALAEWQALGLPGRIFINTSPMLLEGEGLQRLLADAEQAGLPLERLVLEISERYPVNDYGHLRATLDRLRRGGCLIAIDDLGAGYSGLRSWSELRPDFVKIDIHFIKGIDDDPVKRQFVQSMEDMAGRLGCETIAEGVETAEEYAVVHHLGIRYVQGHFFGRPHVSPLTAPSERRGWREPGYNLQRNTAPLPGETVASLLEPAPEVPIQERTERVLELFASEPAPSAIVVVDDGRPVGLVERSGLLQVFASRYGRDLFSRQPISVLMNAAPIIVEETERLEVVSELITAGGDIESASRFIITRDHRYRGIGSVLNLLRRITDLKVRNARYANPLTLLPGNVPIAETIERLLVAGSEFTVCYFDIDHFKPYNDLYGYNRGDEVIRLLADILVNHADPERDFVGHVGGDDFIVVFRSADWLSRVDSIFARFVEGRSRFFTAQHLAAGGMHAIDRRGDAVFYPLLTVSAGAVPVHPDRELSQHEVAQLASEAKAQAKRQEGCSVFIDRRARASTATPIPVPPQASL
jgi:EAL domain-containing protein (putative c-di-GMP-specific phosphodiesterase class I)/GGDEF domain-containing protein